MNFRNSVHQKLREEVVTLDQLNDTLNLLEDIRDMENKIDGVYRPIEELYMKIRSAQVKGYSDVNNRDRERACYDDDDDDITMIMMVTMIVNHNNLYRVSTQRRCEA